MESSSKQPLLLQQQQRHQQYLQQQQQQQVVSSSASRMEAPSAMQQALLSFQVNAEAQTSFQQGTVIDSVSRPPTLNAHQIQQQRPLNPAPMQALQQQFLPLFTVPGVGAVPSTTDKTARAAAQQQQLLWQQALQTLTVDPRFAAAVVPGTEGPATATPFLATLTIPHLMQYNLQQQQLQAQQLQQQQKQPRAVTSHTASPMPLPSIKKRSHNNAVVPEKKPSRKQKVIKRSAAGGEFDPTVISLNGSSINVNSNYVIGSSHHQNNNNNAQLIDGMDNLQPPTEKNAADIEKMTTAERRRYERNLREQQRSYRISQQIKELRDVLQDSNVPFRPNKYSILVSVANYIQELQGRAVMLDSEHQRLIQTICSTTKAPVSLEGTCGTGSAHSLSENDEDEDDMDDENNNNSSHRTTTSNRYNNNNAENSSCPEALMVQSMDYQSVFHHIPYPLGVATLDGRVLASNREFEKLFNTSENSSMTDQSFFLYISNHQEIFEAMADLLRRSTATIEAGAATTEMGSNHTTKTTTNKTKSNDPLLFWCGHVVSTKNEWFPFTITLTITSDDNPKYFSLSAAGLS